MNEISRRWQRRWVRLAERSLWQAYWPQWQLGWLIGETRLTPDWSQLHQLAPPEDRFYADPFAVWHEDRFYIFFEEYHYFNPVGFLSVCTVDTSGQIVEPPRPVLQAPYHLSYPQVFWHDGNWWMLPETAAHGTLELWQATRFPDQWTLAAILLTDIAIADATLWRDDTKNRWRLLAALKRDCRKFGDRLHSFTSNQLLGPWQEDYQGKPVQRGTLHHRPAGALFCDDAGRLIRPAQDSMRRYGEAIEFRHIQHWDDQSYRESTVQRLTAPSGFYGIHTFNQARSPHGHTLTVVDLLARTLRPTAPLLSAHLPFA